MPRHDLSTDAAREDFCRLLATCYDPPGADFDDERLFTPMIAAAKALDRELGQHTKRLRDAAHAEGAGHVGGEHERLFGGTTRALADPRESAWFDGVPRRESLAAIVALYEEGGFEIDAAYRALPDHIGEELRFLHLAIFKENQALRIGTPDECEAMRALRERFVGEHLTKWVRAFADAIRAKARGRYYRELAELTERFVRLEGTTAQPA